MNNAQIKNSPNREKKAVIVAEVAEKVGKAKAMIFTDYAGLTHKQLEGLKRIIKKDNAQFAVTKNTLLKLALEQSQKSKVKNFNQEEDFKGQTGTMFIYGDIVAPLKALAKMIKDLQKPEIKFGFLEGKILTKDEIIKLSTLPSREQLIAQLAGLMKSPIFGLHRALQWNIRKFVMTLSAVVKTKTKIA